MTLIINRNHAVSTKAFGKNIVLITTAEAFKILFAAIKQGKAQKVIDNEETLSYRIEL